jgi:hypothetical protein
VLLLQSPEGIGIDVALGGVPFEEADRPRDWNDVAGVVTRQASLDWDYIETQIRPLAEAKESPQILDRLSQLRLGTTQSSLGFTPLLAPN